MSKRKVDRSREASQASLGGRSRSRSRSKAPSATPSKKERRRDDDSREHSDCTEVVESGRESSPEVESQTHFDLIDSYNLHVERLKDLRKVPTKKNILRFIHNQLQVVFARSQQRPIPNLQFLEKIDDQKFWSKTIPHMLDSVIDSGLAAVPLLKSQSKGTVTITRKQAHALLCHMFLCTLEKSLNSEYVNFGYLFSSVPNWRPQVRLEKLRCMVSYFQQATTFTAEQLSQNIIYERLYNDSDDYLKRRQRLFGVEVTKKNIQQFEGQLMVDFANMMIGGGFLKNGAVQEEILFAICPELSIGRLICGIMEPNDAIVVHGFRQYCQYEGYSDTFKFHGVHNDRTPVDIYNKLGSCMIALDALDFSCFVSTELQYEQSFLLREIHKAYVGFSITEWIEEDKTNSKKIITGKWGCGAFKGDPQLKFVLQWLACSWAGRDCVFVNWGPDQKNQEYEEIISLLKHRKTTEVLQELISYGRYRKRLSPQDPPKPLFSYLKAAHK